MSTRFDLIEIRIVNDEPKIQNHTNHAPYNDFTQFNQFIYQSVILSVRKSNILSGSWTIESSNDSGSHTNTYKYVGSNKVRELISGKVIHTSLLNTTVVAFKVLPLGSYAPMQEPSPPFKTILELVLWNCLQSCRCFTPEVINVIEIPSFQYFLYLREQKKVAEG